MDPGHRSSLIAAHIRSTSRRTGDETGRLVSTLFRACWPGGEQDRSEPAALDWVRRWPPVRVGILPPACSCHDGRCALCN